MRRSNYLSRAPLVLILRGNPFDWVVWNMGRAGIRLSRAGIKRFESQVWKPYRNAHTPIRRGDDGRWNADCGYAPVMPGDGERFGQQVLALLSDPAALEAASECPPPRECDVQTVST